MPILGVNICHSVFLVKLACQKNILLNQNCRRATINNPLAIFALRTIKFYRPWLAFFQVDDESIFFGIQTFFVIVDLVGLTSTCCFIDSCLRICCSLLFWVWDKPEGHHLGYKYFDSCLPLFSHCLTIALASPLTRLLLQAIGCHSAP